MPSRTTFFIFVSLFLVLVNGTIGEETCHAVGDKGLVFDSLDSTEAEPSLFDVPQDSADYLLFKLNYVYRSGGKGEFKILTPGSVLQSGDHYKIMFTPMSDCYVYIFQVDSANKIYQLFPMEGFAGVTLHNLNPVRAGRTYYIPAEQKSFILDQQTGMEKIYFLSSRARDPELEAQYQQYLDAQQQQSDLSQQPEQPLEVTLEVTLGGKEQAAELVADPAETKKDSWEEGGQTFSVLQQRLENMCDGCVYVLSFKHE